MGCSYGEGIHAKRVHKAVAFEAGGRQEESGQVCEQLEISHCLTFSAALTSVPIL